MNEEKMKGKSRNRIIIGLLTIIVVSGSIIALWAYLLEESTDGFLFSPQIVMKDEKTNDSYMMIVNYIDIRDDPASGSYREWLEIEDVIYLLTNSPGYSVMELKSIFNNKSHKYNLGSGNLVDIFNNTSGNVAYYDNDYDAHISLNDTFSIKGEIIDKALNESWGVRLVLIYTGILNGHLSERQFTPLGYGQIR